MKWLRALGFGDAFDGARSLLDEGRYEEAVAAFEAYVAENPDNSSAWFNLGLAHKLNGNWAASLTSNRRSADLDEQNVEARWNMGVAATALRDWRSARWAWRGIGVEVDDGDTAPELNLGVAPVRLNATPDGGGETVWGTRIDPCRVRLDSVPMPESGHRWADIVLHDVVPRGERMVEGRRYSVFDELARMDPSDQPTYETTISAPAAANSDALVATLTDAGLGAEDWTASLTVLCAKCSLTAAHDHEVDGPAAIWLVERRVGLGGDADALRTGLRAWAAEGAARSFSDPVEIG